MSVLEATQKALQAAQHLTDEDAGAVAVLLRLAEAADLIDGNGLNPAGKLDNVTIPTYLRFAESLGLTPAGRARLGDEKPEASGGNKLGNLQAQAAKRRRTA